jgi:hypothetical protein
MPASDLLRDGKFTAIAWVYAAVSLFSLRFAVYYLSRGRFLLGTALLIGGLGDAYFIWAAWRRSKIQQ